MEMRHPSALAAVFASADDAAACALELERHGFARPWMAATHPALPDVPEAPTIDNRVSQNEIAESSDGALGAIGRFFTGEGNSLRRSLEDHGLDPEAAAALDSALPAPATVLVVDAANRRSEALAIVRGHRGATGTPDVERQALEAQTRREDAVVAADPDVIGDDAVAALEREEDATYERRPPM
jgi:hypothetical protein